ncbi:hypothetical protein SprV_0301161400 [Sparganum proliferum]
MKRSRWTHSEPMRHQPDVYLFSHSHPCRKPRANRQSHCRCATAIRPATSSTSTAAGSIIPTTSPSTPPTDGRTSDVLSPSTIPTDIPTPSDADSANTCLRCDRTFAAHIGLIGHLRTHRRETGEPVPEAPIYTRRTCLNCPCTFTHRMGLPGHMLIHDSGIHRTIDTPRVPSTPTMPSPIHTPSHSVPTTCTTQPQPSPHNARHSTAASRLSGKCASGLLLHVTPLLHV